ncbi:MAG: TonB C-terminal domain-containing protein [Sandaracinus sp.]|nr:TonB C-terminal domain-containing protein [Sandaracinus sp.]
MSTASSQSTGWIGVGASLVLHAMLAIWVWRLPPAVELLPIELAVNVAIEGVSSSDEPGSQERGAADPRAGGGLSAQNVDALDRGQGGDESGAVDVVFLVSRAHGATLQDSAWNAPRVSQIQRIDTARDRVSWENRRATPNPDDDPFLASGEGTHRERRPVATTDARAGVAADVRASTRGGEEDVRATAGEGADTARSDRAGSERDTPSRGILTGEGRRASEAANVAFGRPELDPGPAATLAPTTGRVRDDTRSELLAAQLVQSWVDSSERRGARPGDGRGGVGGGGTPGSGGGRDEGGRASAYGPGGGGLDALDTSDRRYRTWYLAQRRRIEERLVFPRERAVALDMGLAVYRLSVRQDGALVASRRVRSSGFGDLDAAAAAAIAAAAPFDPLPPELARRDGVFDLDMTVRFANPLVN